LERNVLSDDRNKALAMGKDVGAESDLLNDLGFNLCVMPWSPVVRLVVYFGVREVAKIEVLRSRVKESEWTKGDQDQMTLIYRLRNYTVTTQYL